MKAVTVTITIHKIVLAALNSYATRIGFTQTQVIQAAIEALGIADTSGKRLYYVPDIDNQLLLEPFGLDKIYRKINLNKIRLKGGTTTIETIIVVNQRDILGAYLASHNVTDAVAIARGAFILPITMGGALCTKSFWGTKMTSVRMVHWLTDID